MQDKSKPIIMFVCRENRARSVIAESYMKALFHGQIEVRSAGTSPATEVDPLVITVMREEGIDLLRMRPKRLTDQMIAEADRVISMGCEIGNVPRIDDLWDIPDVSGRSLSEIREIRNQIKRKVLELMSGLAGDELYVPVDSKTRNIINDDAFPVKHPTS